MIGGIDFQEGNGCVVKTVGIRVAVKRVVGTRGRVMKDVDTR